MEKVRLSKDTKDILRKSSRNAVEQALRSLKVHLGSRRWVGKDNRYRQNCVKNIRKDTRARRVAKDHLCQYIAASAPLHCADGWSYLGRAINCHNQGDNDTARHLAYYAELRAAVSLLASEGIGIFSNRHFVLDSSGNCLKIGDDSGTHKITWLVLEYWSDLRGSADLLGKLICAGSVTLWEWLSTFVSGSTLHPIGRKWLRTWGLDLRRLGHDRDARNEASYRPNRLNSKEPLDALGASRFLCDLWSMCEPFPPSSFEILDRHLLRLSLEQAYEATTGRRARDNPSLFKGRISRLIDDIKPTGLAKQEWENFLTRAAEPITPGLLVDVAGNAPVTRARHHMQVMARAALLLRVATGACAQLLKATGVSRADLDFWWRSIGEQQGFWEPGSEPAELTDLWADVEAAVKETRDWELKNVGVSSSFARWRKETLHVTSVLGECERIALWGLGL